MPCHGHLDRIKCVYGYLCKFGHFKIRFRMQEPDYTGLNIKKHDWANTAHGDLSEELPTNTRPPLGKQITITHYFDVNLMHDVLSGKAMTGGLHFYNKTPIDWHCKKKSPETATYGAKFVSGRTCLEQIIDHWNSLRYLGVPINDISYVFGDNECMINSSTVLHANVHKWHNILSYHFIRSMVACGYISMNILRSEFNVSDILSKHWGYQNSYDLMLKQIFHHIGNVRSLIDHDVLRYIDDRYDPIKHPNVYLQLKTGSVKLCKLFSVQSS